MRVVNWCSGVKGIVIGHMGFYLIGESSKSQQRLMGIVLKSPTGTDTARRTRPPRLLVDTPTSPPMHN